jgi:xeroderma pigmentosum group C-complementing protein
MPRASSKRPAKDITREVTERGQEVASPSSFEFGTASSASMAPRNRLGHPNAADYHIPEISSAPRPSPIPKAKPIIESPYPIFWVEVFDSSRQKWNPVDPLVTETISRPYSFEPPANDRENSLSYVIAFEEDGIAKDVTRRYSKAYNAKLRKNRVECTPHGDRWWRKAMRPYRRGFTNDADQIEDSELAACEAREPMPKNVLDFKDHPYYALERHLKRNEVLISTRECGKVAAGRDASKPGGKKLESVYRRKDVRVARSADKWYRLGRDVKLGEVPVKTVEPKKRVDDEEGDDDRAGTNLYVEEQTELYVAPPVVNGRIPRNSFGNLDVFVPSMVPKGGVHIMSNEAVMAARLLGIDYAPALTGFEFRGRHGTAVLSGAVVAEECREAVEAVIEGMRDEQARVEEEMRALRALKFWKRFLVGLRIKERVDGYAVEGEDEEAKHGPEHGNDKSEMEVRDGSEDSDEYVDDGGGGFFPE